MRDLAGKGAWLGKLGQVHALGRVGGSKAIPRVATPQIRGKKGKSVYKIHKKNKKKPKKGRTLMDTLKDTDKKEQKTSRPVYTPPPISPEDASMVKKHLESQLGKSLLSTLEPISRRDLHPNNLNISYDPLISAVDIHVVFVDTNTPLWMNLQRVMWRNRMTWRFDGTGPQLMLIVRWFLPYEFPKIVAVDPGSEQPPEPPSADPPDGREEMQPVQPPSQEQSG